MIIKKIEYSVEDIKLKKTITIGVNKLLSRKVIYLYITDENNNKGIGESAPLDGFGTDTIDQVLDEITKIDNLLNIGINSVEEIGLLLKNYIKSSSLCFALEQALLDLLEKEYVSGSKTDQDCFERRRKVIQLE